MPDADERMANFVVGDNYQVLDVIGEGAYGIVCSALHLPSQRKVAIKRITPFDHSMFCLQHHLDTGYPPPPSLDDFKEVYLVQELMETDLHRVIRTQQLSDDHCQYFIYQTLRALKALHSADVLHRDLKPSNLLLNANCDLKLCDFGLARSARPPPNVANDSSTFMTEYVATRWYRAPEVMLTFKEYTRAIDIWSVGCVLAEMLSGRPLFPGRDCIPHQLSIILDILGTLLDDFYAITSPRSREYIRALPFRKKKPFSSLFPEANPLAIDLMEKCLTFSPKRRIEVQDAFEASILGNEPTAEPLDPSFFDFDNGDPLGKEQLKYWHHWRPLDGLQYGHENDLYVFVFDITGDSIDRLHDTIQGELEPNLHSRITGLKDVKPFMDSLCVDKVIQQIREYFTNGDIILDGGNELYRNAKHRQ
ncbi:Mitogen-activated protein kinase 2 [Grifola frondosa]|uniref:Mitogen-activated protein kinase 2 n=1 Tax=Grifola frondosa TaxID=5627 RepID=A0A1C7LK48_GRIFR|nr:Mitogen-activated protein kinase 2 [Grifola frondosa]